MTKEIDLTDKTNAYEKLVSIAVIVILSCTTTLFALDPQKQISQFGYSTWSRQNGLPANALNIAIQTHDGYLWLGTTFGLLRFDGVHFDAMSTDTIDSKNREVITALCETRDGSLWIGTGYTGLRRLKDGKLLPCGANEGFSGKPIKALFESRAGHLWIGSSDGLFEYINGRFKFIPTDPLYITSITEDSSGKIFIGTGDGVRSFEEARTNQINSVIKKNGLPDKLATSVYAKQLIRSIYADHQGNIWIGTGE